MSDPTTRRAVLGAISAASLMPVAAVAAAPTIHTPEVRRAYEIHQHALVTVRTFDAERLEPVAKAYRAARDKVPHATVSSSYENVYGARLLPSTADRFQVADARRVLLLPAADPAMEEYYTSLRELVALDDAREAEIMRLRDSHGIDALEDESEQLEVVRQDALEDVLALPSRSLADLQLKVAAMDADNRAGWEIDAWAEAFIADVRQLCGGDASCL